MCTTEKIDALSAILVDGFIMLNTGQLPCLYENSKFCHTSHHLLYKNN